MEVQDISKVMNAYISNQEMLGGALIVRKNDEIIYQNKWGFQNLEHSRSIEYDTMYRLMSMSKCVTGVAVMKLIEEGKIRLDDKVSKYIPEFAGLPVCCDPRYISQNLKKRKMVWNLLTFRMDKVKTEPAKREITIRDLLSHASGLEQGWVGLLSFMKMKPEDKSLEERIRRYTSYILDFQPGTDTGYSPMAGFDILGFIVSLVSGKSFEEYLRKEVFAPLEMKDTTFFPNKEQEKRLVRLVKRKGNKLVDVTDTKEDTQEFLRHGAYRYEAGCGGLYGTITDYEHMARMLCSNGMYQGKQFLRPETVCLMHTEAQKQHLEPEPGFTWGLSVKIRQNPELSGSYAHKGTYGWSGAFGTHFFVCPDEKLEAVFMTNRSDLGGSGSYISEKVEELVFGS